MNTWDYVRACNLILYVALIAGLIGRSPEFPHRWQRALLIGLYLLLAGNAWQTIDAWLRGAPGGPRLVGILVPLVVMNVCVHAEPLCRAVKSRRTERTDSDSYA